MPACRYCQREFGSWWPRNKHETTCPTRREIEAARVAEINAKLRAANNEKRRLERERAAIPRYPNGRKKIVKSRRPLGWLKCRRCGGRAMPYTGDGNGQITALICLDCGAIVQRRAIPSI